jgi:stearoyl-CoA desaturase (Delta-9 desaturase)
VNPAVDSILTVFVALACAFALTQAAMLATTIYLHRYLAHGSVVLRPEVRGIARFALWVTTAIKPRQWARVHRFHHAAEDTPADPHSPLNFGGGRAGARHVLWHNGPLYTAATHEQRLVEKYKDLRADRLDRALFDRSHLGLGIGATGTAAFCAFVGHLLAGGLLGFVVGAFAGATAFGLHGACYLLAGGVINGYGHASAQRSRESGYAKNMPVIAYLTVGEGWHRNHHAAENSPRFGVGCQFDLGWTVLAALRMVRLADVTARGATGWRRLQAAHAPSASVTSLAA